MYSKVTWKLYSHVLEYVKLLNGCANMIVDGNYKFLDFEKVKPKLINILTKFYGNEYRAEIKNKLDAVRYNGFHVYSEVVDYYNEYIQRFRNEIIERFFEEVNIEYSEQLAHEVFPNDDDFLTNIISMACEGGLDVDDSYSEDVRKNILESREKLKNLFNLGDDKLYYKIKKLKKSLYSAIDYVESQHDCDVFRDVRSIRTSKRDIFKKYLCELCDLGFNLKITDGIMAGSEEFDDSNFYDLDSFPVYFGDEYLSEGLAYDFTYDLEEDATFSEKFDFIYSRLRFLEYSDIPFKYIEGEIDDVEKDYDGLELLEKEYEYQKRHFTYLNTFVCEDEDEWKKDWKKGNFMPRHMAESLEYTREEYQNKLFSKCKNFDFYKKYKFHIGIDGSTTFHFDKNNGMAPYFNVFINESVPDMDYILSTLIHELNHVLGFYPVMINDTSIECKEGISMISFEYLNKVEEEQERWDYDEDAYLEEVQENVIERIAREIFDLFIKEYENPYVGDKSKKKVECEYSLFNFITDNLYKKNQKLFRDGIISMSHKNLYYDSDGYYEKKGPIGSLIRKISDTLFIKQDEKRTKFSVRDIQKVGELIRYFEKEILYFVALKGVTLEEIENGEYKNKLSPDESERLSDLLSERDRLNKLLVEEKGKRTSILQK